MSFERKTLFSQPAQPVSGQLTRDGPPPEPRDYQKAWKAPVIDPVAALDAGRESVYRWFHSLPEDEQQAILEGKPVTRKRVKKSWLKKPKS